MQDKKRFRKFTMVDRMILVDIYYFSQSLC